MTEMAEADLADFVSTSAVLLGLQLDRQGLEAARDAMRSMLVQVGSVLDYDPARAAP